jgi:hypothetical protein
VTSEASILEQHLSTRRELLLDDRNEQIYTRFKDTAITRTPEADPRYPHEIRPPRESENTTYLNGEHANAGIRPSQFATPASPKHDGSLILPTEVVPMDPSDGHPEGSNTQSLHYSPMDLSDGHPDGSNTQSLHYSPMDRGSAPLDRANQSSQEMATEKACMERPVQNRPNACCTDLVKRQDLRPSQTSSRRLATPNRSHR